MSSGHFAGILTLLTGRGSKGRTPSGKFRNSPKAGSGAEWPATLRNLPVISPPLSQPLLISFLLHAIPNFDRDDSGFCGAEADCRGNRKAPLSTNFLFPKQADYAPLRCGVIGQLCAVSGTLIFFSHAYAAFPGCQRFSVIISHYFCFFSSQPFSFSDERHKNNSHKHFPDSHQ